MIQRPGDNPAERTRFLESVIRRLNDLNLFRSKFSNWTSWTPTIYVGAPMTISSISVQYAQYNVVDQRVSIRLAFTANLGGSGSDAIFCTLPVGLGSPQIFPMLTLFSQPDNGGMQGASGSFAFLDRIDIRQFDGTALNSSLSIRVIVNGAYFLSI